MPQGVKTMFTVKYAFEVAEMRKIKDRIRYRKVLKHCRDEVFYAALTTESDKQDSLGTFRFHILLVKYGLIYFFH